MRLGTVREPIATPDLDGLVGAILARRLRPQSRRPVALGLSGGGDSLALLLASEAWARRVGRDLVVLTVDHRLQHESGAWTAACAATAARLGLAFQALDWMGDKPSAGLSAAARAARHRLLANAARQAGAGVILLGHTADDILEARLMRAAGATTPEPREWSPSPAWPQGRGVFLLRPLIDVRRADIRDWLRARGERWIEDPANESPLSARARARRDVVHGAVAPAQRGAELSVNGLAQNCNMDASGGLRIARAGLRIASPGARARFVSAACLCAAGTDRPPAREATMRLSERLASPDGFAATLAGARIEADDGEARFLREAGEAARGGLQPLHLAAGETGVWDGRFEIVAERPMEVRAAAGLRSHLAPREREALAALPARARDAAPVVIAGAGHASLLAARPLALERLLAACGTVEREPA